MIKEDGLKIVQKLINDFEQQEAYYTSKDFQETETRNRFIDPFFEALGWDFHQTNISKSEWDVHREFSQKDNSTTKKPDYAFRVIEGAKHKVKFFVEAKASWVKLTDLDPIFQAKRYAFSSHGKTPIVILTDFQEFRVFNGLVRPIYENPMQGLIKELDFSYKDYIEKWDFIWNIFSKEAVQNGSINLLSGKINKHTKTLDEEFLSDITNWREVLAKNIALRNNEVSVDELNEAVQRILDRLIFIRNLEDRDIEPENTLFTHISVKENVFKHLIPLFRSLDSEYNGLLFKEHFSENMNIDDKVIIKIIKELCYPLSPYQFDEIEPEILGRIYEKFLGSKIRLTVGHQAKVEEKIEVRHAGGVYYTPQYIVEDIVRDTIGEKIKGLNPEQIAELKVCDPSCGSGSFLLGAYDYIMNYHKQWYEQSTITKYKKDFYYSSENEIKLTMKKRTEILQKNIFGVDLDREATEVAIMSLYLKLLDDGFDKGQIELFMKGHILPDMTNNIRCGNSIISSNYLTTRLDLQIEELRVVKPFDWFGEKGFLNKLGIEGFDCVIGNPPYIDSEEMTKTQIETRRYCVENNFKTARGNWDMYCVFSERGISLLKNGGFFGYIIPNKFISAPYGEYLKSEFAKQSIKRLYDYSSVGVFYSGGKKINVYPFVVIVHKSEEKPETEYLKMHEVNTIEPLYTKKIEIKTGETNWSEMFDVNQELFNKIINISKPITDHYSIESAATTAEAYEIKKLLEESSGNQNRENFVFVNTGTIDRYNVLWEEISTQYIKDRYKCPIVNANNLKKHFPRRFEQAKSEKLILAGMVLRLEAIYDDGKILAGKSTTIIINKSNTYNTKYLLGLINSKLMSFIFTTRNRQTSMSGGYINVNKGQIESLPFYEVDLKNKQEKEVYERIISLVEKMEDLYKKIKTKKSENDINVIKKMIEVADVEIDKSVYSLYRLDNNEVSIIESLF